MEIWKDVVGYEGHYLVSSEGRIKSVRRIDSRGKHCGGMIMKQRVNKATGYLEVGLFKNGKRKVYTVHRLVAIAFIPQIEGANTVNHKNEDKIDNRVENLEWLTLEDNLRYGTHTLRATLNKPDMSGSRHFNYGKRGSESHTHKGKVIGVSKKDPNITVEFDTAATASRQLGISSGQLCDAINGKAKSCGGYYWRRENG